jgi:hypothetical protein
MTIITLLKRINDVIVYQYFKWYIHDIKFMNKHGMIKEKNYILGETYLNICYKDEEFVKLSEFVKKFKLYYDYISIKDICIAILCAYYNLSLSEYDDIIAFNAVRKYSYKFIDVKRLYMGIVGISSSIRRESNCCYFINNQTFFDYDNNLNKELRKYFLFGL